MITTFLEGLSSEEQKQALLRISQFILRGPTGDMRESIYKSLIEIGILLKNDPTCTLSDIMEDIEKQFFGIVIDVEIAEEILTNLLKEEKIQIDNGNLTLSKKRQEEIEEYSLNTKKLISDIEKKFIDKVSLEYKKDINADLKNLILDSYYYFILLLISKYVVNTAIMLVRGKLIQISLGRGEDLIYDSLYKIDDKELKKSMTKIILDWMQNPEEDFIKFLYHMRQNFLCIEVLNLDPQCRTLSQEEFSKINIYLDNNVLISYVFDTYLTHQRTKKLISHTIDLGSNVVVTKRTLEEFYYVLNRSFETYRDKVKKEGEKFATNDNFIINYNIHKEKGYEGSIEKFYSDFKDMPFFLEKNRIKYIDEVNEELTKIKGYDNLIYQIQRCFMLHRGVEKKENIAEHDAYHIIFVKTLRESETATFLGSNNWFLTYDLTLPCVDLYVNRVFYFSNETSANMIAYLWEEIISPFLIGKVKESELIEVFKQFLDSDFRPISNRALDPSIIKLDIDWSEFDWLEYEEIKEMVQQKFVIDYIERQIDISQTGDERALNDARDKFNISLTSYVAKIAQRKIYDVEMSTKEKITELEAAAQKEINDIKRTSKKQIKSVEKKLEEKEQETEKLRTTVEELVETKDTLSKNLNKEVTLTLRMRYAAGISGLVLFLVGIFGIIWVIPTNVSLNISAAYVACLIIGAFLLLLSIKPEQISGSINLGIKTNQ